MPKRVHAFSEKARQAAHSPEVQKRRTASLRRVWRERKAKKAAAARSAGQLILATEIPGEQRPHLVHEGAVVTQRTLRDDKKQISLRERADLAKGLIATVALIMKG